MRKWGQNFRIRNLRCFLYVIAGISEIQYLEGDFLAPSTAKAVALEHRCYLFKCWIFFWITFGCKATVIGITILPVACFYKNEFRFSVSYTNQLLLYCYYFTIHHCVTPISTLLLLLTTEKYGIIIFQVSHLTLWWGNTF